MSKLYVAVDIGCLECGEGSEVIGVFESRTEAECQLEKHEAYQKAHWTGDHSFEVFEVEGINIAKEVEE